MKKIFPPLIAALLLMLLLTSCSGTGTVTVTLPPVTATITQTLPPVTSTITQTPPPVTVTIIQTPPPVTTTITPTWIASIYRGSLNITYTGKEEDGTPINGTCPLTIDANGDVTGSLVGKYSGNVVGQVDPLGNFIAIGTLTGGTTPVGSTWSAHISLSGKSLSVQGNWSGEYESGTFSGSGNVSY